MERLWSVLTVDHTPLEAQCLSQGRLHEKRNPGLQRGTEQLGYPDAPHPHQTTDQDPHLLGPDRQTRAVAGPEHVLPGGEALLVVVGGDPQVLGGEVPLLGHQAVRVRHEGRVGEGGQLVGDGGAGDGVDLGGVVELPDAAALRGDDPLGVVHGLQVGLDGAEAVAVRVGDRVRRDGLHVNLGVGF